MCITVGVYPSGADNQMYVDYYYVGGGQNPLKDAIPKGSLTFKSYLPNGKYDYRYLYVMKIIIKFISSRALPSQYFLLSTLKDF